MTPQEFAGQRRALSEQVIDLLVQLFLGLGSWRQEDADRFVAEAVPLVQGAQQAIGSLTAAYMAQLAGEALGEAIAPPGLPLDVLVDLRRGVTPDEVYRRPFATVYNALSKGKPLTAALEDARARLQEIAELDLQQTYSHAARESMRALPREARPTLWRRELIGSENCALCVVASTQRYTVADLKPIHPGCDCLAMPIYGDDPGQVIAPDLLEKVHEAVQDLTGQVDRGARAPDYRKIMVQMTREHGELGPLLVRPLDRFTSKADLPS